MKRSAFTLVELLVVVGLCSMLIGMLMPAIQKIRAAADKLVCANHLRQMGIAVHLHHNDYLALPAGLTSDKPAHQFPYMTWMNRILPYIEQDAAWNLTLNAYQIDRYPFNTPSHLYFSRPMKLYSCPADDRTSEAQPTRRGYIAGLTSYVGCLGTSWNQPDGVLFVDSRIRLTDIKDGTAYTIMAGERPPSPDCWFGWWYASFGYNGTGSPDVLLGGYENNPLGTYVPGSPPGPYYFKQGDLSNMSDIFHFWSLHPGGANFLMADGSVQFLNYDAAPIIRALSTRSGGEAVELP